jgi:hypothetical protein
MRALQGVPAWPRPKSFRPQRSLPRAGLGSMESGRASGDAAAHDRHVGALVAGERPEPERRSRAAL